MTTIFIYDYDNAYNEIRKTMIFNGNIDIKVKWISQTTNQTMHANMSGEFVIDNGILKFRLKKLNKGQTSELDFSEPRYLNVKTNDEGIVEGIYNPSNKLMKIWDSEESYPAHAVTQGTGSGSGGEEKGVQQQHQPWWAMGGRKKRRTKKKYRKKRRKKRKKTLRKKLKRRKKLKKTKRKRLK